MTPDRPTSSIQPSCRTALRVLCLFVILGAMWWSLTVLREERRQLAARGAALGILTRQQFAWNGGNLDEFMAEYWRSDDLTFYSGGTVTSGWQATLDRYRKRYQADGKEMGTLEFDDLRIEVLAPDAAVVRGRWKLTLSKESPNGLFTLVLKRFPDGWKIVHDHTSAADLPKPP